MSTADLYNFIARQIYIYFGLFILISGVIGGILNTIIFTTFKTFRATTCGLYLITLSLVKTVHPLTVLFVRILSDGFGTEIRKIAWICKLYSYAAVWCTLVSMTILCLTVIDQCISMSAHQRYSTNRSTRGATLLTLILCSLYCICIAFYWSAPAGRCVISNPVFAVYSTRFHFPILLGFLPLTTMTTFSLLAFHNARTLNRRQINIVRLSRDRQLTAMILCHVIYVVITTLPFIIFYMYTLNQTNQNPERIARNNLIFTIATLIYFSSFASPFYIYCSVSERFRNQLLFVLMKVAGHQRRQGVNNGNNNQGVSYVEPRSNPQPTKINRVAVAVIPIR